MGCGCCGKSRVFTVSPATKRAVQVASKGSVSKSILNAVPRLRVGDNCTYCGSMILEKVKRTNSGWVKAGWCPKCKLEV